MAPPDPDKPFQVTKKHFPTEEDSLNTKTDEFEEKKYNDIIKNAIEKEQLKYLSENIVKLYQY